MAYVMVCRIFLYAQPPRHARSIHTSIEHVENHSSRDIAQRPRHARNLAIHPTLVKFGGWHLFLSSCATGNNLAGTNG